MTTSATGNPQARAFALPAPAHASASAGRSGNAVATRRRGQGRAGFTLFELVLVVVIIAVVVGAASPLLNNFARGRQLGDTADQVVLMARWAHTQAMTRGVNYRLNFDTTKHQVWLTVQNGPSFESLLQSQNGVPGQTSSGNSTVYAGIGNEMGRIYDVPDTIDFTCSLVQQSDGTYVQFRPSGRSDPASVTFSDRNGKVIEVGCLATTEQFHVLTDDERQLEQSMPSPTPGWTR